MKKYVLIYLLVFFGFSVGCVTNSSGKKEVDPYKLAKVVTLSYIFLKNTNQLKPEQTLAVAQVYSAFSVVMKIIDTKNVSRVQEIVIMLLRKEIRFFI